jgi:hypothetical protein
MPLNFLPVNSIYGEEIGDQNSVLWNLDEKKPRLYLKGLNTLEEASAKKLRSLANFLVVPPSFKPLLQKISL